MMMYFMPASLAMRTHSSASNRVGLKRCTYSSYSGIGMCARLMIHSPMPATRSPLCVPAGTHKGERVAGIGEWIMSRAHIPIPEYEEYVHRFNPTRFDADEWVRIANDAGMKYIIITSKHHDGFALFDSKVSSYDIMDATPYKRDAIKALSEAAHRD